MNQYIDLATRDRTSNTNSMASARIRQRLRNAGQRHHANDNIACYIKPGELDELRGEVEQRVRDLLTALVIDVDNDHNTQGTANRIARMYVDELFQGRYRPAPALTSFPNVSALDELMLVGPIRVRSTCSHHICPIIGDIWIGLVPSASSELIGLSKYARLANWVLQRPQIQEEAMICLANELEKRINPAGLAVVMRAHHYCMHWRGIKDENALMSSCVMRGTLRTDTVLRHEFFSLMQACGSPCSDQQCAEPEHPTG